MASPEHQPLSPELIKQIPVDRFSQACDSFVDFQVPQKTIIETASLLNSGHNIALVSNHQSYFEVEPFRWLCQQIDQVTGKPPSAMLFFSAPAVATNAESFLKIREPVYRSCGLNLLPIVRPADKSNKYKDNITPDMIGRTRQSLQLYAQSVNRGGCLLVCPFESTLQGGRRNLFTGEINGIMPDKENSLISLLKRFSFLPCGIDGSFQVISPDNHQPSYDFIRALNNITPSVKPVTFKTGEIINPKSYPSLSPSEMAHYIVLEIAKLVSPEAQGAYRQECTQLLK